MTRRAYATRSDWAEEQLRDRILSGELEPGSRLLVNQLAEELDVSQTPLRESIQRLAIEGLVEIRPQRGAHVVGIDLGECHDIYRMRLLLEPLAIRLALENDPPKAWDVEVKECLSVLKQTFRAPYDPARASRAHLAFHLKLIEPCGSPWMIRLVEMLQLNSARYRSISQTARGGFKEIVREHAAIVDACLRRDVEEGSFLIAGHLQTTVDLVSKVLAEQRDGGSSIA